MQLLEWSDGNAQEFCMPFGAWFPQHSNIHFTHPFCTKKAVKISYSKYIHLVEQKSIHQNSRNAKIGRGSKVRDSGTRGEGGYCDSHGRWKAQRKLVMYKLIQVSPNRSVIASWGNWRCQYLSKGDKCWRTNLAPPTDKIHLNAI
jgi:hypothetical protein